MPYSLKGRNVLVTGGSRGLGEAICLKFAGEGCNVAINYFSNEARAQSVADRVEKLGGKAVLVQADMGKEADCYRAVQEATSKLGGLDIIISNAGHTRFSDFKDLNASTVEDWDTCFAVNVKAQSFLLKEATPTFRANPEGGVFVVSSSIAGIKQAGSCMPYSVTKAAQLHLVKCLAATQGPKVRVNAVLPGLLLTEWGMLYGEERITYMKENAPLKKETNLEDCAQAFVDIARNTSMTGQTIAVDAGYSFVS
ncbi:short-chain dehydrogenase/reductase-like protein sdr [Bisporella sp. PMI_857]|nr:short-chain dehydrogenase/reductase-like protein sdr [Bisporella sp. PMI_857]